MKSGLKSQQRQKIEDVVYLLLYTVTETVDGYEIAAKAED